LGFASTSIRVGIQDRVSLHFFQPGLGILEALAEEDSAARRFPFAVGRHKPPKGLRIQKIHLDK
jgi:hypothetical protein